MEKNDNKVNEIEKNNDVNEKEIKDEKGKIDNLKDNENKDIKTNKKNEEEKNNDYFSNVKFLEMNLNKILLERLNLQGYEIATEVQAKSIPIALKGEDIIGSAKTGNGKSLAFFNSNS